MNRQQLATCTIRFLAAAAAATWLAPAGAAEPETAPATAPLAIGVAIGPEAARRAGEPLSVGGFSERVERQLRQGYALARDRLEESPSCRALFSELGADGLEVLHATVYLRPRHGFEREVCATGAPALTFVGARQTRLCDGFGSLSRPQAAMLLLHEALHHAGLDEWPHDPDGLKPFEINRLVARSCGL